MVSLMGQVSGAPREVGAGVCALTLTAFDQSPEKRPVNVTLEVSGGGLEPYKSAEPESLKVFSLLPAGMYLISASASTPYGVVRTERSVVMIGGPLVFEISLPLYDVVLKLITRTGRPIVGATVIVGTVDVGSTDADGTVLVTQIPSGNFSVSARWLGRDISPTEPLHISTSNTYSLTASRIAFVQIQAIGVSNQGLSGAHLTITPSDTASPLFSGMTDADGMVSLELPYGDYDVKASFKGTEARRTITVLGDTLEKIKLDVFIELFGKSMTFVDFMIWLIAFVALILLLLIAAQEYNIYRRRKLPELFRRGE